MEDWYEAENHAERARAFLESGDWPRALRELRAALEVDPDQSDWLFGMGLALDALQRHDEAAACFEQVVHTVGDDAEAMLHLGVSLIRAGRYRKAVRVLSRAARIDPDCEPAYCYRIKAYTRLGRHDSAEQMFYLAQQLDADCPMCFDHIAESLAIRTLLDKAIWCWRRVLALEPEYPDIHRKLAAAHWRKGQRLRAAEHFQAQLEAEGADPMVLLELGSLLTEMRRYDEAEQVLRRSLRMNDRCAATYLALGRLAAETNAVDDAHAHLGRARELDPDLPGIHLELSRLAMRLGKPAKARRLLQLETARRGRCFEQEMELAAMLIEVDQPWPAIGRLTRCLSSRRRCLLDSESAWALSLRARAYAAAGRRQQSLTDARHAYLLDSSLLDPLLLLFDDALDHGRLTRAAVWLRKALRLAAADPAVGRRGRLLRWARWRSRLTNPFLWITQPITTRQTAPRQATSRTEPASPPPAAAPAPHAVPAG